MAKAYEHLTDKEVERIIYLFERDHLEYSVLAVRFHCSATAIARAIRRGSRAAKESPTSFSGDPQQLRQ
jgi:hypothetical protein